ncbi:hypothetical protein [Nocardia sputorum]|uniref:Uncharacterized protein n=1 Tax=Nocardia sputorum TaxID=2984338 RepID=A0ABN6UED4_9NOCA|nr:hypothetical protein [Nocardia sputorum]BDU03643.1 hypothetical protein IFM12276_66710 [Nocardia sputorum]
MKLLVITSGPPTWSTRWFVLRCHVRSWFRREIREPGYTGEGQWHPHREYGGWVIRPASGWRRFRWITPRLHYTRAIPADDMYALGTWMLAKLEM